jgi:glycosyltransferase involved in cell wall biosynthesis
VVLAEAYARGVPLIGPRHGAFAEFIEDGETGSCSIQAIPCTWAGASRALVVTDS